MQKDLRNHSINDLTLLKRKRECKRLHDEHLAGTSEEYRTISRGQQIRHRKGQQFGCNEEYDYAVETGWRFYKGLPRNLPTCYQLRHRRQRWTKPIGRRTVGILCILQGLTTGDIKFFSELGPVSVAWRKTSRQPTGSLNSTPTNTARTELHSMITFHHANTRGSRAGRLRIAHLCVAKHLSSTCHV